MQRKTYAPVPDDAWVVHHASQRNHRCHLLQIETLSFIHGVYSTVLSL